MLQCVCSSVDHSWRQSVVRTKKNMWPWRAISASCDWSVAIFTTSLKAQESYLTLRNLTLQTCVSITRDFFRQHSTFSRIYNAAASPASRLRSAGSLAIKFLVVVKVQCDDDMQSPLIGSCKKIVLRRHWRRNFNAYHALFPFFFLCNTGRWRYLGGGVVGK